MANIHSIDIETSAKVIYREIFYTFDPPAEVLSDRGSCKIVKVHTFSISYHLQTNSLIESCNRRLVQTPSEVCIRFF